jgi:hypothetical protein
MADFPPKEHSSPTTTRVYDRRRRRVNAQYCGKEFNLMEWVPAAVLPNIELKNPIEGEGIALVPLSDPRIQSTHPSFREFLGRFTDTFEVPLELSRCCRTVLNE